MELTKEELAAQFEKLSTNELQRRFESGTLVPVAHEAARVELLARGVTLSDVDKADERESEEPQLSDSSDGSIEHDFVTIARIVNPLRANLLKVHLESEGIVTHVLGGHLGVVDIVLSTGSGGVHVQVRKDQAERGLEVLERFDEIERDIYRSKEQGDDAVSVSDADEKRKSLNRPASPLFFWGFAIIVLAAIVIVVIGT